MRLFLKIVVYCLILISTNSNNLKRVGILSGKQIYSNFMNVKFLNGTQKINTNQKTTDNLEVRWNYYKILFGEVGDKTFICITLLFYQTKTAYLILTALFTKIIFIYLRVLIVHYSLMQLIPTEIFQVFGIIIYNFSAFSILYKLMFVNLKEDRGDFKYNKHKEESEKRFLFDFESFIKTFGVVFISQLAAYSSNEANIQSLYIDKNLLTWKYLAINLSSIGFGILFSVIIGLLTSKKFSLEFNLIISAITFLLLGIDNAVKFFSVSNEWNN